MSDELARLARIEERVDLLTQLVDAFGPIAGQVLKAELTADENRRELKRLEASIEGLRGDLTKAEDEMHDSLRRAETRLEKSVDRVETSCSGVSAKLDQFSEAREAAVAARGTSRATIIVGALGATATILVAVLPKVLGG